MPDDALEALHVPGMPMLLNALRPYAERLRRPDACANGAGFGSAFWSDSPLAGLGADYIRLDLPASCSYESFQAGAGCKFQFTEPVSKTRVLAAFDKCPGSASTALPYVSLSIAGDWAAHALRPCASLGSSDECGGFAPPGGGAPLVCRTFSSSNVDELWDAMKTVGLVDADFNTGGLAACGGKGELTRKLRALVHAAWGLPAPTGALSPIAFCLPPDDTVSEVKRWFSGAAPGQLAHTTPVDTAATRVVPLVRGNARRCIEGHCNLHRIGDGICHMECFTPECRFDGGDCVTDLSAFPPVVRTRGLNPACMISLNEASASGGVVVDTREIRQNIWDQCNGFNPGSCRGGGSPSCTCPSERAPAGGAGSRLCVNYRHGDLCYNPATFSRGLCNESYSAIEHRLAGAAAALSAWDGALPDGEDALSADRRSGARWPVPATWVDVGEGSLSAGIAQFAHLGCAGDFGMRLGNDALAFGVYAPRLKRTLGEAYGWVSELLACRAASMSTRALSDAQLETRFALHQLAMWAYQFTPPGQGVANSTLGMKWAGAGGFGSRSFKDFLFEREPELLNASNNQLRASKWGTSDRMAPPDVSECSFDSLSLGGETSRGDRRCRTTYLDLGDLLSIRGQRPLSVNLHLDVRQDTCGGAGEVEPAAVSSAQPMPPTLAAHSLPSLALYVESPLLSLFSRPALCSSDADCIGTGGGAFLCVDVVKTFLTGPGGSLSVGDALPPYLQDPLASFTSGLHVDGSSQCANSATFTRSLRSLVRRLAGQPPDSSSELKMCLPDLKGIADKASGWARTVSSGCKGGSCLSLPAAPPESSDCTCRACPTCPVVCCPARPASAPSTVKGFVPLGVSPPIAPGAVLAPDAADGLLSPVKPDARAPVPGSSSAAFVVALVPSSGSRTAAFTGGITNLVKATLRRGLAWALARRGLGVVSTDSIGISGVSASLGGAPGSLDISFTISLPPGADPAVLEAVRVELTSGAPGTVGAEAGVYLAWMGVVDAADAPSVRLWAGAPSSATASVQASPSSSPSGVLAPVVDIVIVIDITVFGITIDVSIDVRVWAALRRALTCNVVGIAPSYATLASVSDGVQLLRFSSADAINAATLGGGACSPTSARRRLAGSGPGIATAAQRGLLGEGGGNVTFSIRVAVAADALPVVPPAPGQSIDEARVQAQAQAATSLLADAPSHAAWLPANSAFYSLLQSEFGATDAVVSAATARTEAPVAATPAPGPGNGGSAASSSTLAGVGVGAALLGAMLAIAVVVLIRSRNRRLISDSATKSSAGASAATSSDAPESRSVSNPFGRAPALSSRTGRAALASNE